MQVITINLPRTVLLSKEKFYEKLTDFVRVAINGLIDFRDKFQRLPKASINSSSALFKGRSGEIYYRHNLSTYSIGITGLNEMTYFFHNRSLLEDEGALAEEVLKYLDNECKRYAKGEIRVNIFNTPLYSRAHTYFANKDQKKFNIPNIPSSYTYSFHIPNCNDLHKKLAIERKLFRYINSNGLFYVDCIPENTRRDANELLNLSKIILVAPEIKLFTYKSNFAWY